MRRLGINLLGFEKGISLEDRARMMKEVGFEATFTGVAQTASRQAEIAEALAKHGIFYESLHAPFDRMNDIWLDVEGGQLMLDELKTSVDRCAMVNAPILVVHLSNTCTPPPPTDMGRRRFIEFVEYAATKNVKIAFENMRSLANIAWAFEEFDQAENVGFCWDCGHEYCFTPGLHFMPLFGKKLIITHIHDNNREYDRDRHLIPFDGDLPFDLITKQIKESGFKGTLMLETFPRYQEGIFDSYQDYTIEKYLIRSAEAAKKLRTMIDGE